ncbi:MAG: sulfotransferase [Chloroflexi bacterium]|nr:sulfotransferase [Chloroflexota bacterium]
MADPEPITIVSGLPRSGTSMAMKMLEAGGIPTLIDNIRVADEDNPKGYYEFERVKQIATDQAWLEDAKGRVVKMVAALLLQLPPRYRYDVVFMRRRMEEVLASQNEMLVRQGKPVDAAKSASLGVLFQQHLKQVEAWLAKQPNIRVLYVSYNEMLADPLAQARSIQQFLGRALDTDAMAGVVDPSLYRNRKA